MPLFLFSDDFVVHGTRHLLCELALDHVERTDHNLVGEEGQVLYYSHHTNVAYRLTALDACVGFLSISPKIYYSSAVRVKLRNTRLSCSMRRHETCGQEVTRYGGRLLVWSVHMYMTPSPFHGNPLSKIYCSCKNLCDMLR